VVLVAVGVVIGTWLSDDPPVTAASNTTETTKAPEASETQPPEQVAACAARYEITDSWPGGYRADVTVVNNDSDALIGWTVRWTLPDGHVINNVWNGTHIQDGSSVTVRSESYNAVLASNGTTTFGLTAIEPSGQQPVRPELTCQSP
jgi:cellulase/cellobiase CelA1